MLLLKELHARLFLLSQMYTKIIQRTFIGIEALAPVGEYVNTRITCVDEFGVLHYRKS